MASGGSRCQVVPHPSSAWASAAMAPALVMGQFEVNTQKR
jgi:hypothetical protein